MALDGSLVWTKDRAAVAEESGVYDEDTRFNPTNASFRPDGGYYLGDGYGSHYLFEYDREDRFVHPHDACFDAEGNLFLAEWVVGGRLTKLRHVG